MFNAGIIGGTIGASALLSILKKGKKYKNKKARTKKEAKARVAKKPKATDAEVKVDVAKETKATDAGVKERSEKALMKRPMTKKEMANKLKRNKGKIFTQKPDIEELLKDKPELLKKYLAEKKSDNIRKRLKLTKKKRRKVKKALKNSDLKKLTKGMLIKGI